MPTLKSSIGIEHSQEYQIPAVATLDRSRPESLTISSGNNCTRLLLGSSEKDWAFEHLDGQPVRVAELVTATNDRQLGLKRDLSLLGIANATDGYTQEKEALMLEMQGRVGRRDEYLDRAAKTGFDPLVELLNEEVRRLPSCTDFERQVWIRRFRYDVGPEERMRARDLAVLSLMPLAIAIAKKYGGYGCPVSSLVSCNLELLLSIARDYNPLAEGTLYSYAGVCMRNRCWSEIWGEQEAMRISVEAGRRLAMLKRMVLDRNSSFSPSEIAKKLGIKEEAVYPLLWLIAPPASLGPYRGARTTERSSGFAGRNDLLYSLLDQLIHSQGPDKAYILQDERMRTVLGKRLKYVGKRPPTFDQLGKELGLTRQRAHQLYEEAIQILLSSEDPRVKSMLEMLKYSW